MTNSKCFKCGTMYESTSPEDISGDGYCHPCFETKVAAAKSVDAKIGPPRPQHVKPELPYRENVVGGVLVRTYTDPATELSLGR